MAKNPGFGKRLTAEVTGLKGKCSAGHKVGDTFELSMHDTGGLCGAFYHAIFPEINVMQFGGAYPWGGDEMEFVCPDTFNLLKIKVRREG